MLIRKTKGYKKSFPKYKRESRKGKEWCAEIFYHAREDRVDTIGAEDVKFTILGAIEDSMQKRILHLEPGTVGFDNFTSAEYLEEMLGRFMNTTTKGGAKEEFEQKKQGADNTL